MAAAAGEAAAPVAVVVDDDDTEFDGDDDETVNPAFDGLEALFEDWIVDNDETPMIVPQSGTQFSVAFQDRFRKIAADAQSSPEPPPVVLTFRQDPEMRARELPDDGSCPLRETLSETERVSATGAVSWNGGVSLGHFCVAATRLDVRGRTVVELGAGTGVCGIMAAAVGAVVTTTDREELIPVLERNALLNEKCIAESGTGSVEVVEYKWGDKKRLKNRTFDFIMAADCIYDMEGVTPLIEALRDLSHGPSSPAGAGMDLLTKHSSSLEELASTEADADAAAGVSDVNALHNSPQPTGGSGTTCKEDNCSSDGGKLKLSATRAFVAYDTAIGHYEVYKVRTGACTYIHTWSTNVKCMREGVVCVVCMHDVYNTHA